MFASNGNYAQYVFGSILSKNPTWFADSSRRQQKTRRATMEQNMRTIQSVLDELREEQHVPMANLVDE